MATIVGTASDDHVFGTRLADTLVGLDGDDTLEGGPGGDTIEGGDGDDLVLGGAGDDDLDGGSGIDTVSFAGAGAGLTVQLGLPDPAAQGEGSDNLEGFEDAVGSRFGDTIGGNGLANLLDGGAGDDTLDGLAGFDKLRGGGGDDTLGGGSGLDKLGGGDGDDLLRGGLQADQLTGGAGADRFQLLFADSNAGLGVDLITDFAPGADKIDVHEIDAVTGAAGDQDFRFVQGQTALEGCIRFALIGADTVIFGNTDADADAEIRITLDGLHPNLSAHDFVL